MIAQRLYALASGNAEIVDKLIVAGATRTGAQIDVDWMSERFADLSAREKEALRVRLNAVTEPSEQP